MPYYFPYTRIPFMPRSSPKYRRNDSSLPSALAANLPSCAQPCVASYLHQAFIPQPCSNISDFGCLCSHYDASNYTVGEISLACLKSGCQDSAPDDSQKAYKVCDGITGAVSPTHSVLTLLNSAQPTSSSTSSLTAASTTGQDETISTAISSSSRSSASQATISVASIPSATTPPDISATTSASAISTTAVNTRSSGLSTVEKIAVPLACIGGLVILVALLFCCACARRRRQQRKKPPRRRHSFDFVDISPTRLSPFLYAGFDQRNVLTMPTNVEDARGLPADAATDKSQASRARQKDRSVSPSDGRSSLESMSSERTTSQLLPGKPTPTDTCVITQFARPSSIASKVTEFEEDKTPYLSHFPAPPKQRITPSATALNTGPRFADHYSTSPEECSHPKLSIRIPGQPRPRSSSSRQSQGSKDGFHVTTPKKVHQHPLSSHPPAGARISMPPSSAASYLPSYYTSAESRTPVLKQSISSPRRQYQIPPVPVLRRPVKNMRASQASETSFESVDPEEPTPPEQEEHVLTPIQGSPISYIRYPKIPRSSNQAVPRSPPTMTFSPSTSGSRHMLPPRQKTSTLVSKRRGDQAAEDLERRLKIDSQSTPESDSTSGSQAQYAKAGCVPLQGDSSQTRHDPAVQRGARQSLRLSPWRAYDGNGRQIPRIIKTPPSEPPAHIYEPFKAPMHGIGTGSTTGDASGYESSKSPGHNMQSRSPLWEPRLTPSKREDDLYISVASP